MRTSEELLRNYISEPLVEFAVPLADLVPPDFSARALHLPEFYDLAGQLRRVVGEMIANDHLIPAGPSSWTPAAAVEAIQAGGTVAGLAKLSVEGGREWERVAQPNWDKFYAGERTCDHVPGDAEEMTVYALRRELIETLIANRMGNSMEFDGAPRVEPVGRWNATYWKDFASGFRMDARFRALPPPPKSIQLVTDPQERYWRAEWRMIRAWRRRPWNHPRWPFARSRWGLFDASDPLATLKPRARGAEPR